MAEAHSPSINVYALTSHARNATSALWYCALRHVRFA